MPHEPSSFSDEHEFSFRHNLIRDGAYDSLPKALRADKHAGVARWAEERAGDRADEIAELIATHLLEALRYLDELGETGERRTEVQRTAFRDRRRGARTPACGSGGRRRAGSGRRNGSPTGSTCRRREGGAVPGPRRATWGTDPTTEIERVPAARSTSSPSATPSGWGGLTSIA